MKNRYPCLQSLTLILFTLGTTVFSPLLWAVNCSSADITLANQSDVDNFQTTYGGGGTCGTVTGTLTIQGADIANLAALSALASVGGDLDITFNDTLTDIGGLSALSSVGGELKIFSDNALTTLNGLSALTSVGSDLIIRFNTSLTNIDSLSALSSLENVTITDNAALTNIDGLSALTSVGNLDIENNDVLPNIDGLAGLTGVTGALSISDNAVLTNINSLSGVTSLRALQLNFNPALTNIDGLSALRTVELWLYIQSNPVTNFDGLSALTSVGGEVYFAFNEALTNIDGLSALTNVGGSLGIAANPALISISGLSALTNVGGALGIDSNDMLTKVDGLSALTSVGLELFIGNNPELGSVDGLSRLTRVTTDVKVQYNPQLSICDGLARLLDPVDDGDPGPGTDPVWDVGGEVFLGDNFAGCNSIPEILGSVPLAQINSGLNDAWTNPDTRGQGFFVNVFPDIGRFFLGWFTYETERPPANVQAVLGEPGHRWLTAFGDYVDNIAVLDIELTQGGIFDSGDPMPTQELNGTIILEFTSCNAGTVTYDISSIGKHGVVPIQRIALDNVARCYLLNAQAESNVATTSD